MGCKDTDFFLTSKSFFDFFEKIVKFVVRVLKKGRRHMDKNTKNFLALDCGATSCRAILATFKGSKMTAFKEICRFPNGIIRENGRCFWDIREIFRQFLDCIRKMEVKPDSIGIDTWGVDFGHIGPDGSIIGRPRAYRDSYTDGVPEEVFANHISADELYGIAGLQTNNFNSIFQLYAQKKEGFAPYADAARILFIPDLLIYMFTGKQVCEYTEASTSGLIDPVTRQAVKGLPERLGLRPDLLAGMIQPGEIAGFTKAELGIGEIPVVAVASHDTASAIAAVPAEDGDFAYLSSGTWSLMGLESPRPIINKDSFRDNFTNEGGIDGTTCFLKNITGMWLLEECRRKWKAEGLDCSYDTILKLAMEEESFPGRIDPEAPGFSNPTDMEQEIKEASGARTRAQVISCIYHSLAEKYKEVLEKLKKFSPAPVKRLHIIGGGSANTYLNQLTANTIGLPVVAGPTEATAIGNILMQARAAGLVKDKKEMRNLVLQNFPVKTYNPENQ